MKHLLLLIAAILPLPLFAADKDPQFQLPDIELVPSMVQLAKDGQQVDWGHGAIKVPEAQKATRGKGSIVAILDTGIDSTHPDLAGQVIKSKNFTTSSTPLDIQGHGTHCAGIVAAADNTVGVVGVAPDAKLINLKVLGDNGSGSMQWTADAVDYAVAEGAHIISMSLGAGAPHRPLHEAIKRAEAKGLIVIAAAGNDGPRNNSIGFPGGHTECVCVGAHDINLNVSPFSSRGQELDVSAPGTDVLSTYPGAKVARLSGTSMATPYVAGVAALYVSHKLSEGEKPSPAEFKTLIKKSSISSNPQRPNPLSGYGRINAPSYVAADSQPEPMPEPKPKPKPKDIVIPVGRDGIKEIVIVFDN